jgi:hypothetical protein
MSRRPKTPYPFPDLPAKRPIFPEKVSRSTPLVELVSWWLDARCTCAERYYFALTPFRLMSAQLGWNMELGAVLDRLKCHGCGGPPTTLDLVEDGAGGDGRAGAPEPKRLSLKPLLNGAASTCTK